MNNGFVRCARLGCLLLVGTWVAALPAEKTADAPAPRPKFKNQRHVPVTLSPETRRPPPPGYELVFDDEFDGDALNSTKWVYRTDEKMLSRQQPSNVTVGSGCLQIALRKEPAGTKAYSGGGVISRETFCYGYFEARFKTPDAEGWHTSFWAQKYAGFRKPGGPRDWLELDFCEQDGGDPHFYSFGIINKVPDAANGQTWSAGRWVVEDGPDTSADFHVWACEFTPDKIRFYFDGHLAKEESSAGFPHDDMSVWLTTIAATLKGDRWVDDSKLPNAVQFDYVRVSQHPKYREAEVAMRALAAKRVEPPVVKPAGNALKDLN